LCSRHHLHEPDRRCLPVLRYACGPSTHRPIVPGTPGRSEAGPRATQARFRTGTVRRRASWSRAVEKTARRFGELYSGARNHVSPRDTDTAPDRGSSAGDRDRCQQAGCSSSTTGPVHATHTR
ncbi:hypothetical protein pipiens_000901, partial [Culex pipiens pipiens]